MLLTALNPIVSEGADIVLQCTRTADRPPRLRSQRSRTDWDASAAPHLHGDRGVPALGSIARGDRSPADPGGLDLGQRRTSAFFPTCMSASPGQAMSQIIADGSLWPTPRRPGDPPARRRRARRPRRPEPAVPRAGERGDACVVLVDSREPAYVSHPAGLPPSFRHRRGDMGPRTRHPVASRWDPPLRQ